MKMQRFVRFVRKTWRDWWRTIAFALLIVVPIKSSIADWNWVPTGSMNPTILEGELVYVNKLAYALRIPLTFRRLAKWSQPARGDIVICFSPEDGKRLVKRVVGLPGDIIESRANVLFINGQRLRYTRTDADFEGISSGLRDKAIFATEDLDGYEHAVMSVPAVEAMRDFGPFTVPQGSYFVMGDNRDVSRDSRYFGFVEGRAIVGKVKAVILSFDKTDKYQPRLKRIFSSLK